MKKLLTILALASAATFVHAQGTIILQQGNAAFLVSTNAALIGQGIGPTAKTALGFDYAVLLATYGGPAPSSNPLDGAWTGAVLTGVNFSVTAGGISGQGGGGGAVTPGWGAPAATYTDGTEKYFMIVGWSSNLGTTWATVAANMASGWATPWGPNNAFFGTSAIGFGFSGGGPFSLPANTLFNPTAAMPGGLSSGFQLMAIVPEPTTIALAGLGGLSLLLFRRRK